MEKLKDNQRISVLFMFYGILFCVCLITANVLETKQISFGPANMTAGLIVFPVSYIINDVVCEVWGYRRTRLLIWLGFAMNFMFVVFGAMYLLLFFSKLTLRSRVVNWLAISALSVYLTHSSSFIGHYYDGQIRSWFYGESRFTFILYAALFIAAVFFGSILIDKLRLLLWKLIARPQSAE